MISGAQAPCALALLAEGLVNAEMSLSKKVFTLWPTTLRLSLLHTVAEKREG